MYSLFLYCGATCMCLLLKSLKQILFQAMHMDVPTNKNAAHREMRGGLSSKFAVDWIRSQPAFSSL
ncbi:hypothetical protein AGR1B_Cc10088 [Agrobacterium fabacearum S56]|nr:hypothetical protein AGR1B_Cc10088 [Agrobacterium fabacearum S56]CUW94688.1 hypothetical protein AGR1C_Cc50513 [Agrobacterium fabacearum TT111]